MNIFKNIVDNIKFYFGYGYIVKFTVDRIYTQYSGYEWVLKEEVDKILKNNLQENDYIVYDTLDKCINDCNIHKELRVK